MVILNQRQTGYYNHSVVDSQLLTNNPIDSYEIVRENLRPFDRFNAKNDLDIFRFAKETQPDWSVC